MRKDPQLEILQRLRTSEGHLRAVIEMAEAGKPCEQILHQLKAIQSALHVTSVQILRFQIQCSQAVILASLSPQQRIAEFERLQSLYANFVQYTDHHHEVVHE